MGEVRGYCTLCRSRCGGIYTVEAGALVSVRPDVEHPTGQAMCPKGRAAPEIVHSPDRLTRPLRRTTPRSDPDPRWREIGWDEALAEIAERLGEVRDTSGPEAVAFSVTSPSGTAMSDSIDWVERFIRLYGSPNICYSTEICNWHKDYAHAFTFGSSLPAPDYAGTDLAILWGHNPAKTWLAQSTALAEARSRGARLAVVDPRRSTSALQADHWLRVRPGTDAALAMGIAHELVRRGGHDEGFVRAWSNGPMLVRGDTGRFLRAEDIDPATTGFVVWNERTGRAEPYDTTFPAAAPDALALRGTRRVRTRAGDVDCVPAFERYAQACAEWPVERTAAVTGVEPERVSAFVDDLAAARSVAYAAWSGVGQSANATQTERAIATLYALTGSYDAPGGNVVLPQLPVNAVTGFDQLAPAQRAKALGAQRLPLGPPAQGWVTARDLCEAILDERPYPVRALVSFGGNLLLSQPDPVRTAAALRNLEFSVHLDLFMNPTAQLADIVLPVGTAWEREAIRIGFAGSERGQEHVQHRPRMVEPVGQARSDTEVVFDLAQRLGMGADFFDGDVEAAWNHQLAPLGITVDELRERPGGIRIPLTTRHRKYADALEHGGVAGFATPTRRVELYSERLAEHGYPAVPVQPEAAPDLRFPLVLTCAKSGHFCHSQHRGISSLRRRSPEPVVDVSGSTAAAHGIADGDQVEIATANASVRMRARIDPALHPDVVVAEHGWWQSAPDLALAGSDPLSEGGANYNLLIDDAERDPVSGSVPMRATRCAVRPVGGTGWSGQRGFEVAATAQQSDGVVSVRLRPRDGSPLPDFRPGQHITLATEDDPATVRSYSLTCAARDARRGAYDIAVRRVEAGHFSAIVHERFAAGTRVRVTAPNGLFAIPTEHRRPVVLLAAGVGVTPFVGYLETVAACGADVPEIVLHHGSRGAASHVFGHRIRSLAAAIPNLRVIDHYSRPGADEVAGRDFTLQGRVRAEHVEADLIRRRALFYVCGPEGMLEDLVEGLVARGVPRFEVFTERFRSTPREVAVPDDATARVRFARSDREVRWHRRDGTLLQLAERQGLSLPSGCRLGQCESCTVPVLQGEVAHLVAPGDDLPDDQCLTCQSIPVSDVVLDA
ncbi:molybdopterin-dependent oxidoreductase [Pseudonocardia sp. MH-G8]|uniref:molybdopterin-dependent oxidoreductase n=1 Tax=Pseudonocardia sp. MH-G8 TaxID=1854588 RepID=UPI000BA0EB29|nr:molybdopterin-dependent oxidoreductase [Pseudonocardia sp. MH-G8]OZM79446.1 molybdopterin dinucleotide-binding protein [Pseudonocardia sp. MH-G8]